MTRRDSEPQIPPAKAHTVPLPVKQRPAKVEADEPAAPVERAPEETEQMQTSHMPLDAVDREIADEADRLLQGGVSVESPVQEEYVPPAQIEAAADAVIPAAVEEAASSDGMHVAATPVTDAAHALAPTDAPPPQPQAQSQPQPAPQPETHSPAPAEPQPETQVEPEPEPVNAQLAASSEPEAEVADKPQRPSWLTRAARMAVAAVIGLLVVINAPLRFLPEPARTIFNWFAASLLLWVPAIWFIALYVI